MSLGKALSKNLVFWHWYPDLLIKDLSAEQLNWQPQGQDTSVMFALWHAYRATDELIHGMAMGRPSVFTTGGWARRLPVPETGASPFGNGMTREQIGNLRLDPAEISAYAVAVGASIVAYCEGATDDELGVELKFPFFSGVYPNVDVMTKADAIMFFAMGHVCEHLGEVQLVRGLMGLKGAPL